MSKNYIGIDNGVSGSFSIITNENKVYFYKTPIKNCSDYQKTKKSYINRLIVSEFEILLISWITEKMISKTVNGNYMQDEINNTLVLLERPMINSFRFNASISAARCLEAQLIVIEKLKFPFQYIDSKAWQKELLPEGLKESKQLKKASLDIGKRLFPSINNLKHGDFDSLLIAEWGRRNNL